MSGSDVRADIESEFAESIETARAYLQAVGVLDADGDGGRTPRERREREHRIMRDAILKGETAAVVSPNDPFARHAATLGHTYLHYGYNSEILDTLLEKDCSHPSYREALEFVASGILARGADMPEQLRRWEQERAKVRGKWTPEATRDYRIGLVIEAMAAGKDDFPVFFRHRDTDRGQLERDLKRVYAKAGNPPVGLLTKDIVTALKKMNPNRWRKWNDGQGLTECDLLELLKQPSFGELHAIMPETKVRTCFPNLLATRNPAAKREVSICDAVAQALAEGGQERAYDTVVSIWKRYKKQPVL